MPALRAGDAAGADATFGEGISPALGYGELAARAIDDAFARGDFSFAGYGRAVATSALGRSLARRTKAARLLNRFHWPIVQKMIWWRMTPVARWYITKVLFNWGPQVGELPPAGKRPAPEFAAPHTRPARSRTEAPR